MRSLKVIALCVLVWLVTPSFAGSYQGKVKSIFAYKGKVFVSVSDGVYDNSNTCTGQSSALTLWLDPSVEYDKAMLSLVLTAKVTEKLVWVSGGVCIAGPLGQAEKLAAIDFKG